jgi:hypothetical protein
MTVARMLEPKQILGGRTNDARAVEASATPELESLVALKEGNSPEVIFGHYRELVTPEAAQGWFNVTPA